MVRRRRFPKRSPFLDTPGSMLKERLTDVGWIVGCGAIFLLSLWFVVVALPGAVSETKKGDVTVIAYSPIGYLGFLAVGGGMIVASLKLGLNKQLHHWLLIGTGVLFILVGLPYAAMERMELTPTSCTLRSLFSSTREIQFDDLEGLTEFREPYKPWRRAGSPRQSRIMIRPKDRPEEVFLSSRYPSTFYNKAAMNLLFQWSMYGVKKRMDAIPDAPPLPR